MPKGRRRRRLLREAADRLERISSTAGKIGTVLGAAAAGAELLSVVRGQAEDHDGASPPRRRREPSGSATSANEEDDRYDENDDENDDEEYDESDPETTALGEYDDELETSRGEGGEELEDAS